MKFTFILLASFIGLTYQDTTSLLHHQVRDNVEQASFTFFYDSHSGKMIVHFNNQYECYIFPLTEAEKVQIHTEMGLRQVEIRLIGATDTATKKEVPKEILDARIVQACGRTAVHFYLMS